MLAEASFLLTVTMKQQTRVVSVRIGDLQRNLKLTCNKLAIYGYEEWFDGSFTKTVCGAKNRNQLLKAKTIAEELGLVENKDFFLIRDACHTELEPEEFDENGEGMTLTCIGFRPLPDEIAHQISHKFHLY